MSNQGLIWAVLMFFNSACEGLGQGKKETVLILLPVLSQPADVFGPRIPTQCRSHASRAWLHKDTSGTSEDSGSWM